jgi:hypothetical protein
VLERSEEKIKTTDESFNYSTHLENNLIYRLRAWVLRFQHRYTYTEDTSRDRTENYMLLRATRKFVRFL